MKPLWAMPTYVSEVKGGFYLRPLQLPLCPSPEPQGKQLQCLLSLQHLPRSCERTGRPESMAPQQAAIANGCWVWCGTGFCVETWCLTSFQSILAISVWCLKRHFGWKNCWGSKSNAMGQNVVIMILSLLCQASWLVLCFDVIQMDNFLSMNFETNLNFKTFDPTMTMRPKCETH